MIKHQEQKWEIKNPDYRENIKEKLSRQFFMKLMGFELTDIEPGYVRGELILEEKHMQQNYFVHGGVMATAADIVMGFAAYTLLPKAKGVVTAGLNVTYMTPGVGTKLIAEGYVVKPGKSLYFCEAELYVERNDSVILLTNRAFSTMHVI